MEKVESSEYFCTVLILEKCNKIWNHGPEQSCVPLIKGKVPVSKLCEQSPLQDLFGRLVLDEVNDDMV